MNKNMFEETGARKNERIEHLQVYSDEQLNLYDFSEGGIGLYTEKQMAIHTACSLKIVAGDLQINLKASVAHCAIFGKQYRVGFKFIDLKPESKSLIREMSNRFSRGVPLKAEIHSTKG